MSNALLTLLANLALTLSFIVALIFGIAQVRAAERDRRKRLILETLRNFQTREFSELMLYVATHDMPASREELVAMPVNEQILLMQLSQEMESPGIHVAEKLINRHLA